MSLIREIVTGTAQTPNDETGVSLNQKLQSLIQQLGEAIHESVAESPQIAGVVQDIRKHGFDVLLMLEATIGLNEVEIQPLEASNISPESGEEGDEPFRPRMSVFCVPCASRLRTEPANRRRQCPGVILLW